MKKPRRTGYKLGILIIFLGMAYGFIEESMAIESADPLILFFIMTLFVFIGYWRMYQYYKIEKLLRKHNRIDFVDYFNHLQFYQYFKHVFPLPIIRGFDKNENQIRIRKRINLLTLLYYLTGLLLFNSASY